MIKFNDLTFIYDNKPLMQHFSCCISAGEKVVLYGPSGHGKSTLLASVAGFVQPDEGTIYIDNKPLDATTATQVRKHMAWLPQEFTLPFDTVKELINEPFKLRINQANAPSRETIFKHFEQLGLAPELYEKRVIEISGGQRQRIMIMIAVLLRKPLILLDEPTSALDPDSIERVINYLKALPETTLLMVSHDSRFIEAFDRKIYIGD